jgi:DnaK suppressor protein
MNNDFPSQDDTEALRHDLAARAELWRERIAAAESSAADLRADCDLDAADSGAKTTSIEEEHARTEEARSLLEQTLAAIGRLDNGTFGICTSCGTPIGRERLLALPHTELCVNCRPGPARGRT